MMRVLAVAGAGVVGLVGYLAGCSAGHSLGVSAGVARADFEWARMLENGMVGPTQTTHPLRGKN